MYCARCGAEVGASEFRCPRCALDLHLAGSVRLTNPALDSLLPGRAQASGASPRAPGVRTSGSDSRFPSSEEAVTRLLPTVDGSQEATRVTPIAGSADAQMTQVLGRASSEGRLSSDNRDSPRLLNPSAAPAEWGDGGSGPFSRTPRQGADESLPPEWFRDPQAEYDGAIGSPARTPAPVFKAPAVPQPAPAAAPAPVTKTRGRLGPVLVAMLVVTVLVLIGVVWWVLSNLTSKADGQIQPTGPDSAAAAGLVSGAPPGERRSLQPASGLVDSSDPLDAA